MSDLKITSEKDFFRDYERAKHLVDKGIRDYFILYNNDSFGGLSGMSDLTLAEIEECYGEAFIRFLRFGFNFNQDGEDDPEMIWTIKFRRIRESDKKKLRGAFRFFPKDCWVCEWVDAAGYGLLMPFTQKKGEDVRFLVESAMFRNDRKETKYGDEICPKYMALKIMSVLPWYAECAYAIVNYNDVDIAIPIDKSAGKKTFKNRERDELGVKRRLIHHVTEHTRKSLVSQNNVSAHLRGASDLRINGVNVTLAGSWEWGNEALKKRKNTY